MKIAISFLAAAVVALGALQWHLSVVEQRRHEELLAALADLERNVGADRAAALSFMLPVPGLGEVKFSAEVPTEDIARLGAVSSAVTKWLFAESE